MSMMKTKEANDLTTSIKEVSKTHVEMGADAAIQLEQLQIVLAPLTVFTRAVTNHS